MARVASSVFIIMVNENIARTASDAGDPGATPSTLANGFGGPTGASAGAESTANEGS